MKGFGGLDVTCGRQDSKKSSDMKVMDLFKSVTSGTVQVDLELLSGARALPNVALWFF